MRRVYLDSNILIAYYAVDESEKSKKELVQAALRVFGELVDVQLCTSTWAITEMVNTLIAAKRMDPGIVAQIENQITNQRRLEGLKVSLCEVSLQKNYDFSEFFYDVRKGILSYHSGVGDIIHSVIMKNNGIDEILTFDEKDDFKKIPDLTVIHPKNVRI
jgi:predicted nucleic acid-binding protein